MTELSLYSVSSCNRMNITVGWTSCGGTSSRGSARRSKPWRTSTGFCWRTSYLPTSPNTSWDATGKTRLSFTPESFVMYIQMHMQYGNILLSLVEMDIATQSSHFECHKQIHWIVTRQSNCHLPLPPPARTFPIDYMTFLQKCQNTNKNLVFFSSTVVESTLALVGLHALLLLSVVLHTCCQCCSLFASDCLHFSFFRPSSVKWGAFCLSCDECCCYFAAAATQCPCRDNQSFIFFYLKTLCHCLVWAYSAHRFSFSGEDSLKPQIVPLWLPPLLPDQYNTSSCYFLLACLSGPLSSGIRVGVRDVRLHPRLQRVLYRV